MRSKFALLHRIVQLFAKNKVVKNYAIYVQYILSIYLLGNVVVTI